MEAKKRTEKSSSVEKEEAGRSENGDGHEKKRESAAEAQRVRALISQPLCIVPVVSWTHS